MKRKRNLETGIHDLLFLLFFSFALYPHRERKKRKRKKGGKKKEKKELRKEAFVTWPYCHVVFNDIHLQLV